MIRVLIVEDSDVVALLLRSLIDSQDDMEVVGRAANGKEAVEMAENLLPDLITMDIRMPVMDGFDATRQIMENHPTPIVVISASVDDEELRITFRALEEGALTVLEKPPGLRHPRAEVIYSDMIRTLRMMAEVPVVRRFRRKPPPAVAAGSVPGQVSTHNHEVLAIVASTGGPAALHSVLAQLPADFPLPIVIVQHIAASFAPGLAGWLEDATPLQVKLARNGEVLQAGTVYIGGGDEHVQIARSGQQLLVATSSQPPVNGFRPSGDPLLESVAAVSGDKGIGVVLTGMGRDGAEGLLAMRRAGAMTLAQDEASSVVYGMPAAAAELGAAVAIMAIEAFPQRLLSLASASHAGAVSAARKMGEKA